MCVDDLKLFYLCTLAHHEVFVPLGKVHSSLVPYCCDTLLSSMRHLSKVAAARSRSTLQLSWAPWEDFTQCLISTLPLSLCLIFDRFEEVARRAKNLLEDIKVRRHQNITKKELWKGKKKSSFSYYNIPRSRFLTRAIFASSSWSRDRDLQTVV